MINILIADDHSIVREGLKQIVAESPEMSVQGEAVNPRTVHPSCRDHFPIGVTRPETGRETGFEAFQPWPPGAAEQADHRSVGGGRCNRAGQIPRLLWREDNAADVGAVDLTGEDQAVICREGAGLGVDQLLDLGADAEDQIDPFTGQRSEP